MGQVSVYAQGQAVGTLDWEEAGLYWQARAQCRLEAVRTGVPRLWVIGEQTETCLGVPDPMPSGYQLERRLAKRSWQGGMPLLGELRWSVQEDWTPWPQREGVYCRRDETGLVLAAPWQNGGTLLAPMFCLGSPITIGQTACLAVAAKQAAWVQLDGAVQPAL